MSRPVAVLEMLRSRMLRRCRPRHRFDVGVAGLSDRVGWLGRRRRARRDDVGGISQLVRNPEPHSDPLAQVSNEASEIRGLRRPELRGRRWSPTRRYRNWNRLPRAMAARSIRSLPECFKRTCR